MGKAIWMGALLAFAAGVSPVRAQETDEAAALRAELSAVKADYEARLAALEARLARLEERSAGAASAAAAIAAPEPAAPQPPRGGAPAAGGPSTAFNPAISLILSGTYASLSEDPGSYAIAGFIPSDGETGPGERNFSLGESELTLASNVDPYFYGQLTAAVTADDEIEIEEAFFRTLALPAGFTLKGGRFFSGVGYLNEVHAHAWDFVDLPLAYQAFFGGQLAQEGLQLKWLAPTDLFLELGVEAGNGSGFPGTTRNRNALNGATLFAHAGGDIGVETSWRAGAAWLTTRAEDRVYEDTDDAGQGVLNAFTGRSRTWMADVTLKWAPQGNFALRYVQLQAEYLRRIEDGDLTFDTGNLALTDDFRTEHSGWYVQGVYQFRPRWRAGLRYDELEADDTRIGLVEEGVLPAQAFPSLLTGSPQRLAVMLDFNPSEFSRLRLQYAWDEARADERDRQLFLQYLFGVGAHGAHRY